jgi:predicted nucleotidyltransferase
VITDSQINIIKSVLAPFEPEYVGVFGSFARGEQTSNSDLDILVRFGKRLNLFDLIGLEQELSEKLQLKVDLVTENSLSPLIRKEVMNDIKKIA